MCPAPLESPHRAGYKGVLACLYVYTRHTVGDADVHHCTRLEVAEHALDLVDELARLVVLGVRCLGPVERQEALPKLRDHEELLHKRVHVARCAEVAQPDVAGRPLLQLARQVVPLCPRLIVLLPYNPDRQPDHRASFRCGLTMAIKTCIGIADGMPRPCVKTCWYSLQPVLDSVWRMPHACLHTGP